MRYYKRIEPKEGEMVQFLAVYATRWPWDCAEPTEAFIEVEDGEIDRLQAQNALLIVACKAARHIMRALYIDTDPEFIAALNQLDAAIAAAEDDA